tara:strand:+ start:297 stop:1181 length:885 start_codon:yes stop_codon:yes gene_type:complete
MKFLAIIIGLLMLLTACGSIDVGSMTDKDLARVSDKLVVCNQPYIRFGTSCCLDQNENNICDNDEKKKEDVTTESTPTKTDSNQIKETSQNAQEQPIKNNGANAETSTSNIKTDIMETESSTPNKQSEFSCTSSITDLSNYPCFLMRNNKFNGIIVVGNQALAEEVLAAKAISTSLGYDFGIIKLDNEVEDITMQHSILIGNACTNGAISKLLGNPSNCGVYYTKGEGNIELIQHNNGLVAVVVSGYDRFDITNTGEILSNYEKYNLKGTKAIIEKCGSELCIKQPQIETITLE